MEEKKDDKPSWYSMHKEQIKLIQFLLYHLRKHKEKPVKEESKIKVVREEVYITFD